MLLNFYWTFSCLGAWGRTVDLVPAVGGHSSHLHRHAAILLPARHHRLHHQVPIARHHRLHRQVPIASHHKLHRHVPTARHHRRPHQVPAARHDRLHHQVSTAATIDCIIRYLQPGTIDYQVHTARHHTVDCIIRYLQPGKIHSNPRYLQPGTVDCAFSHFFKVFDPFDIISEWV